MSVVYDDAQQHVGALPGDLPHKAAATHIGIFFAWATQHHLISDMHLRDHQEAFSKLERRWFSGRDYVLAALDGRLTDAHLNEEGRRFAEAYYVSGRYLEEYDATLMERHATRYHVRDDWSTQDRMSAVLDAAYAQHTAARPAVSGHADVAPAAPPAAAPDLPSAGTRARGAPEDASALPEGVVALPPPTVPAGAPPPPLPPRRPPPPPPPLPSPAPPASRPSRRKRSSGLYWLVGIVLLFLGVRACGTLFDKGQRQVREDFNRRWSREMSRHARAQREHAERMRRMLEARTEADRIRKVRWAPLAPEQEAAAKAAGLPVKLENALGMRFVLIPPGTFVMGSPDIEEGRREDEVLHNVEIDEPFYMLTTEVSLALWSRFDEDARADPKARGAQADRGRPITNVSHERAVAFCQWLDERDPERRYGLPTEAQWEYACRAGAPGRYWWGENEAVATSLANVADENARDAERVEAGDGNAEAPFMRYFEGDDGQLGPAVVGTYRANPWGLYDMLGNVREWCADWYGPYDPTVFLEPRGPSFGVRRVLRGGSCASSAERVRCAARDAAAPNEPDLVTGFRVVCTPR